MDVALKVLGWGATSEFPARVELQGESNALHIFLRNETWRQNANKETELDFEELKRQPLALMFEKEVLAVAEADHLLNYSNSPCAFWIFLAPSIRK